MGSAAQTFADINAVIGGFLRDLAFAQSSQQKMFGYKRAAAAILALGVPLTDLVDSGGALPRIPGIDPDRRGSSARFWRPADRRPSNARSTTAAAAQISSGDGSFGGTFSVVRRSSGFSRTLRSPVRRDSSIAATCRCIPSGATAIRRSGTSRMRVLNAAISTRRSPIIHTD